MAFDRRSFLQLLSTGALAASLPDSIAKALSIPANNKTRSKRGVVAGLLIVPVCGCVHDFGCGHNLYEWIG